LTTNFRKILIYIIYILTFFKFFRKVKIILSVNKKQLLKINKKKNLFFKKKATSKYFLSKRLSIVLKKRKKIKTFKRKHIDKGNFFFKKFFFKTILKNRKFLKFSKVSSNYQLFGKFPGSWTFHFRRANE